MNVVSGQDQKDTVAQILPEPLVVVVLDSSGNPVQGQIVNFRVISGGGEVFAGAGITNADGKAQDRWTLGTASRDTQKVEARAVDSATGEALVFAVFKAVGDPDGPAVLITEPVMHTAPAGSTLSDSLEVTLTDKYGNAIPSKPVQWAASGGGSVSPTVSTTDTAGVARTSWTLGGDATQTVTASVTGVGQPAEIVASAGVGPPVRLAIQRSIAGATSDVPFATQPQVRVTDEFTNLVTSAADPITMTVSSGAGVIGVATVLPVNGVATFDGVGLSGPMGDYTITFSANMSGGMRSVTQNNVALVGSPNPLKQLAVGWGQVCALEDDGGVHCWKGTGASEGLSGGHSFRVIAASVARTCGLTDAGAVWCWSAQALGLGTPLELPDAPALDTIVAGTGMSCGLADGIAWCWPQTAPGDPLVAPTQVSDKVFASMTAGGNHACGLEANGSAWCWGLNDNGQLGNGTTTTSATPVQVPGTWTALVAGHLHTCALKGTDAMCWGDNRAGELGIERDGLASLPPGAPNPYTNPVSVRGALAFSSLGHGGSARTQCGTVGFTAWCWGQNNEGQVGDPTATPDGVRDEPVRVIGNRAFTSVSGGNSISCGLTPGGRALCWGKGLTGVVMMPTP